MKGAIESIVTAVVGVLLAVVSIGVIVGIINAMAGGMSTAQSTSQMADLANAINNTCKREGLDQTQVSIHLKDDEHLVIDPANRYIVRIEGKEGSHVSSKISACSSAEPPITIKYKRINTGGRFFVQIENEGDNRRIVVHR